MPGGILMRRRQIEQPRGAFWQLLRPQALLVDRHADDARARRLKRERRALVARRFDQPDRARAEEETRHNVHALLDSVDDDDVVGIDDDAARRRQMARDRRPERGQARRIAVMRKTGRAAPRKALLQQSPPGLQRKQARVGLPGKEVERQTAAARIVQVRRLDRQHGNGHRIVGGRLGGRDGRRRRRQRAVRQPVGRRKCPTLGEHRRTLPPPARHKRAPRYCGRSKVVRTIAATTAAGFRRRSDAAGSRRAIAPRAGRLANPAANDRAVQAIASTISSRRCHARESGHPDSAIRWWALDSRWSGNDTPSLGPVHEIIARNS